MNSLEYLLSLYAANGPASRCLDWIRNHHGLRECGFGQYGQLHKPFEPILPEKAQRWKCDMEINIPRRIRNEFGPVREEIENDFTQKAAYDLADKLSQMHSFEDRQRYVYTMISCFNDYSHCFQDKGEIARLSKKTDDANFSKQLEVIKTLNEKMIRLAAYGYDNDRFDIYQCPIETCLAHYYYQMRLFGKYIAPVLLSYEIDIEEIQQISGIYLNVELSEYDYYDGRHVLSYEHAALLRQKIAKRKAQDAIDFADHESKEIKMDNIPKTEEHKQDSPLKESDRIKMSILATYKKYKLNKKEFSIIYLVIKGVIDEHVTMDDVVSYVEEIDVPKDKKPNNSNLKGITSFNKYPNWSIEGVSIKKKERYNDIAEFFLSEYNKLAK